MLHEEILQPSEFDPANQKTKFYQDPKTGECITVPFDWQPEEVIEVTLTEKAIQLREEAAYQRGYKAGLEAPREKEEEKKKK